MAITAHRSMKTFSLLIPLLLASLPFAKAADPVSEMASFSSIEGADLSKLAKGEPITAKGPKMDSNRFLGIQACYIVNLPLQKAVELHKQWTPTSHKELKVYLHGDISSKPSLNDFRQIATAPGNGAVHSLMEATAKLDPEKPALQMSKAEAHASDKSFAPFWTNLLYQRSVAFASGGIAKQPPYEGDGGSVRASSEIQDLLSQQSKIKAHFKDFLSDAGLLGGGGKLPPSLYYELFDEEKKGAFLLGASYAKQSADTAQLADVQFYATDGFYALVTIYQLWPIKIGSEQATLVWRGDLISSESFADLHGVELESSHGFMMRETRKNISFVQKDAAGFR